MRRLTLALAAASAFAITAAPALAQESQAISAAVAQPDRPEAARVQDENRKPVEVLAFLGLEEGMVAADLLPGAGYWTEIMAHIVAPTGSVLAYQPEQFASDEETITAWNALQERAPGITQVVFPFSDFAPEAESFDFAMMSLNYHDIYWESERFQIPRTDPDAFVAVLYSAMKPGGIVGIIDHSGEPGDTRAIVDATHRIDPAVVRADFERAGFVLADESDMLANPEDDLSVSVFDPSIRGRTDRFVMKFVKPMES